MTQRDWQKDMDDVSHYLKDKHSYHHAEQTLRGTPVADILQYWLQEAKKWRERYEQRPTFELLEAAQSLYEHHNARADAAEKEAKRLEGLATGRGQAIIRKNRD